MWQKRSKQTINVYLAQREFLHSLNTIVGLDQLLENISIKLSEIVNAGSLYLVLFEPVTNHYINKKTKTYNLTFSSDLNFSTSDNLIKWLNVNKTILEVDKNVEVIKFLSTREQNLLHEINVKIVVPFFIVNRLTGAVLLGKKNNGANYNNSDFELLTMLADQSALAIEHSLMYQFQEDKLKKLLHTDKLATIGELAAGAAHEIRNPLTSIRSTVQFLQKDLTGEKKSLGDGIIEEIDRIDSIIKGLLSFSKSSELQISNVNIEEIIDQTLFLLEPEIRKHNIQVIRKNFSALHNVNIPGDASQLKQVFLNIILNSVHAILNEGSIAYSISDNLLGKENQTEKNFLFITIKDTGIGIQEENLQKVFDPFYTTKDTGTGLGLSISYGIVSKHCGDIEISSKTSGDERGTTVIVKLPVK